MVISDTRARFCSGTADGYYALSNPFLHAGAQNLVYTDYAGASTTFLCGVPGCSHDSTACPSCICDIPAGADVFTAYDTLFIVSYGTKANSDSAARARIELRDLDGGSRRILWQCSPDESLCPSVAVDDRYVYYVKNKAVLNEQQDDVELSATLERVAIADGQVTVLRQMGDTEYLVGAFGQNLIIKSLVDGDIRLDAITTDGGPAADIAAVTWPLDDRMEYITDDGLLFYVTKAPCQVMVYDFQTRQTRTLAEDLPAADPYSVKFGAYDGKTLILTVTDDSTPGTRYMYDYAVDTANGGCQPITLPMVSARGVMMNAVVSAFNGDTVLVQTGTVTRTYQSGFETRDFPVYALLSWQDYLAGSENYRAIDDGTLPAQLEAHRTGRLPRGRVGDPTAAGPVKMRRPHPGTAARQVPVPFETAFALPISSAAAMSCRHPGRQSARCSALSRLPAALLPPSAAASALPLPSVVSAPCSHPRRHLQNGLPRPGGCSQGGPHHLAAPLQNPKRKEDPHEKKAISNVFAGPAAGGAAAGLRLRSDA